MSEPVAPSPGQRLGRYRVIAPLGRGGMGGVYEVEDDAGARWALKAPLVGADPDPTLARRFAREANAMRLVEHPNLVGAVDAFAEDGVLYLVMERVVGQSLGRALAAGRFSGPRALDIAAQMLAGLEHAHAAGLVHRDLKPDNIMIALVGGREQVKILDFGLVKLIGDAAEAVGGGKLTRTGVVFGTPMYMAPEQALGRAVDGRADLYATGVILFEMLTGSPPFSAKDPIAMMRMHVSTAAPRLAVIGAGEPWCTPEVAAVVEQALAKKPDERFGSATAMAAALRAAQRSIGA